MECSNNEIYFIYQQLVNMNLLIDYIKIKYNLLLFNDMITDDDAGYLNNLLKPIMDLYNQVNTLYPITCNNLKEAKIYARILRKRLYELCTTLNELYNDSKCLELFSTLTTQI